jgi:hypothetical protein
MNTLKVGEIELRILEKTEQILDVNMTSQSEMSGNRKYGLISGPDEIQLEIAYTIWEDEDGQVETLDHGTSPLPYSRLGHGGRIGVTQFNSSQKYMELRLAKVDQNLWSNFVKTTEAELDNLFGSRVDPFLKGFGAIEFGTRQELLGDISNRRNQICVLFEENNIELPFVVYALTRPLAMLKRGTF